MYLSSHHHVPIAPTPTIPVHSFHSVVALSTHSQLSYCSDDFLGYFAQAVPRQYVIRLRSTYNIRARKHWKCKGMI